MALPFTHDQFLDVFAAFNTALWPVEAALWLASVGVILTFYRRGESASRAVAALLAIHWAWSGVVYHLIYFRTINPAAVLFGSLFIVESIAFAWLGVRKTRLRFTSASPGWARIGGALIVYSLVYPIMGSLFGMVFPRLPMFGVPCPTTILTVGLLLFASPHAVRWLAVIPVLWAALGGSAAIVFGIRADFGLLVAGLMLTVFLARPRAAARVPG